jgi:DDE superfamily endonuclease
MTPDQTLATKSVAGTEKDKDRFTGLLACNSTGSEKSKPLVIGKSARPRCFSGLNIANLPVDYINNKKAWMRSDIFSQWFVNLDRKMKIANRSIILLVDNASLHFTNSQLTNIKVHFLPPTLLRTFSH